ncbi:hypothetical protein EJ04DRAFT_252734 [Polyplosphaeria fusca]|uniref:Uncharacterized protein n=1 Tax=Polyplosphaeria fusca TaxID=682080 RepID=A0A9P4V2F7_9PLEO|nr:hypothetical protein EJ04DRAFT_252734 [Polyplosphaeria fusca]
MHHGGGSCASSHGYQKRGGVKIPHHHHHYRHIGFKMRICTTSSLRARVHGVCAGSALLLDATSQLSLPRYIHMLATQGVFFFHCLGRFVKWLVSLREVSRFLRWYCFDMEEGGGGPIACWAVTFHTHQLPMSHLNPSSLPLFPSHAYPNSASARNKHGCSVDGRRVARLYVSVHDDSKRMGKPAHGRKGATVSGYVSPRTVGEVMVDGGVHWMSMWL